MADDLRPWLAALDSLLGTPSEEHPAPGDLSALAAGELPADRLQLLEDHLTRCARCRPLLAAARAGIAEAEALEQGLARQGAWPGAWEDLPGPDAPLHLLLPLPVPQPAPLLAAGEGIGEPAPLPLDRRVLLEQPGRLRLVYFRRGDQGCLGLFWEAEPAPAMTGTLDGAALAPEPHAPPGSLVLALGPVRDLPGRRLAVELDLHGRRRHLAITLLEA